MSGFEIIGIILGTYPLVISALELYRATRGSKGAVSLARNIKTEEIIFGEFVHHLVAPNVSEKDLARLKLAAARDIGLWDDDALQAKLRSRLGAEKADNVLEILREIQKLLRKLQEELAPIDHGIELLRRFRARARQVRYNLPQSSLKQRLDTLTTYNGQLQRLLADRSLPSDSAHHMRSKPSRRYLRRDSSHAVDVYNAIYDGYRCKCNAAHLANLGLPKISDDSRTDSGLMSGWKFELLFAIQESAVNEAVTSSHMELERLMTTWSQLTIGGETVTNSRRVAIMECDCDQGSEQPRPILDLCIFTRKLDSGDSLSGQHVGFLKLKEKQYQLQPRTTVQGTPSENVECLDHLLTDQHFLMSRKERICLALSLSHAILSLYSTPWIEACWTWKDFCIDRENEGQIFATRKFYSNYNGSLSSGGRESPPSDFWANHQEPILTRLGFALIELALGERLVDLRSDCKYPSSDPDRLDFLTAQAQVDSGRIMREESWRYENVVKVCLGHHFIRSSDRSSELVILDSRRSSFRENAEQSIIAPLHMIVIDSWGNA